MAEPYDSLYEGFYDILKEETPGVLKVIEQLLDAGQTPEEIGDYSERIVSGDKTITIPGLLQGAAKHILRMRSKTSKREWVREDKRVHSLGIDRIAYHLDIIIGVRIRVSRHVTEKHMWFAECKPLWSGQVHLQASNDADAKREAILRVMQACIWIAGELKPLLKETEQ